MSATLATLDAADGVRSTDDAHLPDVSRWLSTTAARGIARRHGPAGIAWLEQLGDLTVAVAVEHDLVLGEPLRGGAMNCVVDARTRRGQDVVVKIGPDPRALAREAFALGTWERAARSRGHAALGPRVHAAGAGYAVLERLRPGVTVRKAPPAPLHVELEYAARVASYVAVPAPQAADAPSAHQWLAARLDTADRVCASDPQAADLIAGPTARARAALGDLQLAGTHLVHGDLIPGNLLTVGPDATWGVIDPRPMLGEPVLDLAFIAVMRSEGLDAPRWLEALPTVARAHGVDVDADRLRMAAVVVAAERLLVAHTYGYFDDARRAALAAVR